jgi:hypothetical protein
MSELVAYALLIAFAVVGSFVLFNTVRFWWHRRRLRGQQR